MHVRCLTMCAVASVYFLGACGDGAPAASNASPTAPHDDAGALAKPANDAGAHDEGPSTSDDGGPTPSGPKSGVLIGGTGPSPGAIAGIAYRSGKEEGVTDGSGTFRYEDGGSITFSIAGVSLATLKAAPKLSPFSLAGGPCSVSDALRRVLVTLETLDADAKPETGIALPTIATKPNETRELATMNDGDFGTWLDDLTQASFGAVRAHAEAGAALNRFVLAIDDDAWSTPQDVTFDAPTSAQRSQGVVFDGSGYVFSWTLGLQRTDANLSTIVNVPAAIPFDLLLAGSKHIGDVDTSDGVLYAPIEDNGYSHPRVVLYDAQTLTEKGARFEIPTSLLSAGIPWVAVDGAKKVAYAAEWDPTPSILVFDLATFAFQRAIPLSQTLGRIQGAKVADGALYAASDDDKKTVYKIDLDTGIVLPPLFDYGGATNVKELEGLTVVPETAVNPMTLRVLGSANGSSITFHTHIRTRASVRSEVCSDGS